MTPAQADLARLAELVHDHVVREEAFLTSTIEALRQVRTGLVSGDAAAMNDALAQQAQAAYAGEQMHVARAEFRAAAAGLVGLAADTITLDKLSGFLPTTDGERLHATRERLRRLAQEVARLNHANAWLTRSFLDFLDRFVLELTGAEPACGRYGPQGMHRPPACGSLIQARG